jgi:8-hydroxy-5-deazaflavin:NADPH oxidoreductase
MSDCRIVVPQSRDARHWSRVDDVLKQAGDVSGKVIVSCSLPMNAGDTVLVVANTSSGAEALARKIRKAQVVSAFGTVPSEVLFNVFEARRKAKRPSLLYCGDDQGAKGGPELAYRFERFATNLRVKASQEGI